MFSLNPFMKDDSNKFGIVKPSLMTEFELDKNIDRISIGVDKNFVHQNCLIEIIDPAT